MLLQWTKVSVDTMVSSESIDTETPRPSRRANCTMHSDAGTADAMPETAAGASASAWPLLSMQMRLFQLVCLKHPVTPGYPLPKRFPINFLSDFEQIRSSRVQGRERLSHRPSSQR